MPSHHQAPFSGEGDRWRKKRDYFTGRGHPPHHTGRQWRYTTTRNTRADYAPDAEDISHAQMPAHTVREGLGYFCLCATAFAIFCLCVASIVLTVVAAEAGAEHYHLPSSWHPGNQSHISGEVAD